jgi:hypothetical protein
VRIEHLKNGAKSTWCDLRATAVAVDSRYGPGYRRHLGGPATPNKNLRLVITGENEEERFRTPH